MILKACVFREVVAGSLGQEAWTPVMVLPQHGCAVSSKLLHLSGPPCSHQTASLSGPFLLWHTTTLTPKAETAHLGCRMRLDLPNYFCSSAMGSYLWYGGLYSLPKLLLLEGRCNLSKETGERYGCLRPGRGFKENHPTLSRVPPTLTVW